jgi:hypothetical protein
MDDQPTSPKKACDEPDISQYETMQLGVFHLLLGGKPARSIPLDGGLPIPGAAQLARLRELVDMLPWAQRFMSDVYGLGPGLFMVMCALQLLLSVEPGVQLYTANRVMNTVRLPSLCSPNFHSQRRDDRSKRGSALVI